MQVAARHAAARSRHLGDDGRAVLGHLGQREAEAGQVRHVLVAGIGEVAAGDLARAFEEVAHHRAAAQPGPVAHRPAECLDLGGQEHGGIGGPASDDHVRTAGQRLDDGTGAEIGVGREEAVAEGAHRLAQLVQGPVAAADHIEHIVAEHGSHPQAADTQLAGDLGHLAGGGHGVGRTHVGDDPDPLGPAGTQDGAHPVLEQGVVASGRVLHPCLLGQSDGALGQTLEDEVVEPALLGELDRGLDPVAREAGTGADPDRPHSGSIPAAFTIRAHFSVSATVKALSSSGVLAPGSMPAPSRVFTAASSARAAFIAPFSLSTTASGVPAGT